MSSGASGFDSSAFIQGMQLAKPYLEGLALADCHDKAERIAAKAKELAPVGTTQEGDPSPGAMRDDIGIKGEGIDSKGPYVDVGTTEPYGLFQEFGTAHNDAHPFMRPAIAEVTGAGMSGSVKLRGRRADRNARKG